MGLINNQIKIENKNLPVEKQGYLQNLYSNAVAHNNQNISTLLTPNADAVYLDLGCDDGQLTKKWAQDIGTIKSFGVEIVESQAQKANLLGVTTSACDLNQMIDWKDSTVDAITANQVIEHLTNSDQFLREIWRVLKPNGYAVISTENASSWANIFASIMGWQIFSLTNFSTRKLGIGNPLAIHRGEAISSTWTHVRIWNYLGLKEYFEVFGFKVVGIKGAGYFPLPTAVSKLDARHSHFITMKIQKLT